ncbi:MAG: DUF3021 domain-containing protein [Coriobacteriales bacterium]|jgi:hypothetical protein|nr:DUF3021 domain-containing protein [Coriobacteriales bacterium]
MLKKTFCRGALGFPLGICIGYVFTIVISVVHATGGYTSWDYSPCVPALATEFGSELAAVIFQAVLCGVLGAAFAAGSVVWEMERWSIAKQTGIYFLITAVSMLPIAYFAGWMERSLGGFLFYFGVFVAIFVIIWISLYLVWRNKIKLMNQNVKGKASN